MSFSVLLGLTLTAPACQPPTALRVAERMVLQQAIALTDQPDAPVPEPIQRSEPDARSAPHEEGADGPRLASEPDDTMVPGSATKPEPAPETDGNGTAPAGRSSSERWLRPAPAVTDTSGSSTGPEDAESAVPASDVSDPPTEPRAASPVAEPTAESHDRSDPATPDVRQITVYGQGQTLERSAEAVQVVDTDAAKRRTDDLGQVLSRTRGVTLRRSGGLGSASDLGLAGLAGAQVPFFVDGIPIDFSPFGLDPANIPVGLVDRIEVYRGVVPIRFGADTLGGAVNLAHDPDLYGVSGSLSYQGGSFDTHRLLGGLSTLLEGPGIYAGVYGFFDHSRNDYDIDVEVARDDGSLSPQTIRKRHDRYIAAGGGVTLGVVDRPWADRLLVTTFASWLDKQLPHNVVMTVPYGSAEFGEIRPGANLRYHKALPRDLSLSVAAAYAQRRIRFTDTDNCVYDWFGNCILEKATAGEITTGGADRQIVQDGAYGNIGLSWNPGRHALRVVIAPSGFTRRGREAQVDVAFDPLRDQRSVFNLVTGAEYEVSLLSGNFTNVVFVKDYVQTVTVDARNRETHVPGVGDTLRWQFASWGSAKASYEWATRLPSVDEIFGDGVLVVPSLELKPERSHNVNLGVALDGKTVAGRLWLDAASSGRFVEDAIASIPEDNRLSSQNVNRGRSYAFDGAVGWDTAGDYVRLDGNVTFIDYRNASSGGPFGPYKGDRMPARPWLLANGHVQLGLDKVVADGDRLAVDWTTHYVHPFFRGWESAGTVSFKQRVPAQVLHGVGASYVVRRGRREVSAVVQVHNLLDARVFDYVGVQRPGRSVQGRVGVSF